MEIESADNKVRRLVLAYLHDRNSGWRDDYPVPEHYVTCPDVQVVEAESHAELWFDTGVEAVRLTARLSCPHQGEIEWEWADLGELPDLIEDMERGLT
jgi:hypothetical protein